MGIVNCSLFTLVFCCSHNPYIKFTNIVSTIVGYQPENIVLILWFGVVCEFFVMKNHSKMNYNFYKMKMSPRPEGY